MPRIEKRPIDPNIPRSTLSTKEVAHYLGVSVDTVLKWTKAENLPVLRIGHKHLYKIQAVDQWFENKTRYVEPTLDAKESYGKLRVINP